MMTTNAKFGEKNEEVYFTFHLTKEMTHQYALYRSLATTNIHTSMYVLVMD
jgi:hypothetical protein